MKYRCEWEDGKTSCARCLASSHHCERTKSTEAVPQVSRKRKDDNRLASLEASIDQLQALVAQLQSTKIANATTSSVASPTSDVPIIDAFEAKELFDFCRYRMLSFWQFIVIPEHMSSDDVLRDRPLLHESMVATAALMSDHPSAAALQKTAKDHVITQHMETFDRSMGLLQSLLLFACWTTTFNKETVLRSGTYSSLALQVAAEMDRSDTSQDWDPLEFDRCYAKIYIAHNSMRLYQDQVHTYNWSKALTTATDRLQSGTQWDENLSAMARLIESGRIYATTQMTVLNYMNVVAVLDNACTSLRHEPNLALKLGSHAMYLQFLEARLLQPDALPAEHASSIITITSSLQSLYDALDELVLTPLDGVPSFLLMRPLISLVIVGRLANILESPSIFASAVEELQKRFGLLGMVSNFCATLSDKVKIVEQWYHTRQERRLIDVITTEPEVFDWELFCDV